MTKAKKIHNHVFTKVSATVADNDYETLLFHSEASGFPKSRLIAIALHNEMLKERPFQLPIQMPDTYYEEFKYADEAGRILNFLRKQDTGLGLDMLYMLRKKIGIEDGELFMEAWRELIEQNLVDEVKPSKKYYPNIPDNYTYYTVRGNNVKAKKKKRKQATEFAKYLRLKKKYGNAKES